jgi:pyruvate dehydrogenase E2 component (dihydrolipoamide acetyltransferase)
VAVEVFVPQMGMMQTEALLVEWLRGEGDHVAAGEAIAVIQTDKTDVEIEAPAEGRLVGQTLAAGESAAVGTVIAYVVRPGDEEPHAQPAPAPTKREESTNPGPADPKEEAGELVPRQAARGDVLASPAARRLSRELAIDIATVPASGPGGRVTEADVRAAASDTGTPTGLDIERPLSRAREITAERTASSFRTIPHLYLETTVDASKLLELTGDGITVTDVILHAAARALRRQPALNATFGDGKVIEFGRVNIGLAVDTPDGLYVPVISEADTLNIQQLSAQRAGAVERARRGVLSARDLVEATFTISNVGVFDVDAAWPIVNQPGVATLSVGRIRHEPVAVSELVLIRPRFRIVLAADHRAVDGAQAARFLEAMKTVLETARAAE